MHKAAEASTPDDAPLVRIQGLSKRFPGVQALNRVNLEIVRGACHALLGENGAGKSTLGKILAGIYAPDEGVLLLEGRPVHFRTPRAAHLAGVGMVHQELAFCENLSVAENLCLGQLPRRGPFLLGREMVARAQAALQAIGARVDVQATVAELPIGQQQLVQIAGAVAGGARLLIFDEPTSSLSQVEVEQLFELIRRLKARGVTSIYVSHRLEEIFELCDTVTVLRDGEVVATRPIAAVNGDQLVQMMIGRALDARVATPRARPGPELLQVNNLSSPGKFKCVSFRVRAGEIVGLAGLVGAGRTEVLQALFGLDPHATGQIRVAGTSVVIRSPRQAMRHGLGLVPEDRKRQGLVLSMNARENISLPTLPRIARFGWIRQKRERGQTRHYFNRLRIRAPQLDTPAVALSGGNQQKLVMAKWLAAQCRLLMLDEPTRGVDVGAKAEIHGLIRELAEAGSAILIVSSELPEILSLADRILIMRRGRIVGELPAGQADQEALMRLMAGVPATAQASAAAGIPL